ncbi:LytR/AlgR family response regulator transcription factor [Aquimarina algiphila]|uniref:LytR/AlgR family response regulator transcription factor n=1 Tax=Aquimarina algiphila TaxID=2047982 RepID=UPI00232DC563|nr:LytTR family DNA-binding domain-containing protein [Aquimarina algiphila]
MNILIIEDEIPAFKKLLTCVTESLQSDFEYTHTRSIEESIKSLEKTNYDLILSDIKIIGGMSFDIFDSVKTSVPIIFCTAFDEHLLKAFQTNGIAYVLKPYTQKNIYEAIKKYQNLFHEKFNEKDFFKQFKGLIEQKHTFKKRFAIKKAEGIKLVKTENVCYIEACGDFCKLKDSNGGLHSISKSIGVLSGELNPEHFFRINRSYIINISFIEKILPYSKNRLSIRISGLSDSLITSTASTKDFRKWIDK